VVISLKVFCINVSNFILFLFFLLEGKDYVVRSGAVVSCVLDMRKEKHSLHFMVDDELIPHAIVNIANNEKMHIGVFHIILFILLFIFYYILFFIFYLFIYLFIFYYSFLFIYLLCSFLLGIKSPSPLFTYQSSHSLHLFQTPDALHIILMDLM
jgi:hypothetical protein